VITPFFWLFRQFYAKFALGQVLELNHGLNVALLKAEKRVKTLKKRGRNCYI
jgi:hypothetical protein